VKVFVRSTPIICRRSIFEAARADGRLVKRRLSLGFGHRNSKSKPGFGSSPRRFRPQGREQQDNLIGNPRKYDPTRIRPAEAGRFLTIDNFHNPMGARIDQNGSIIHDSVAILGNAVFCGTSYHVTPRDGGRWRHGNSDRSISTLRNLEWA
jgi:hypothetical protein